MVAFILLTFTSAILYESLALFVLRREYRSRSSVLFSVLCHLFAVWAAGYTFMYAASEKADVWAWYRFGAVGWCLIPAVSVHFFLHISSDHNPALWRRAIRPVMYAAAVVFLVRAWTSVLFARDFVHEAFYWSEIIELDAWSIAFLIYSLAAFFIGTASVYLWGKKASTRREAKQARSMILTQAIAAGTTIVVNVLLPALNIYLIPSLAAGLNVIWILVIWRSIEKYRLFALTPASTAGLILDRMTDGIMMLDDRLRITQCNAVCAKNLGLTQREIIGRPASEFFSLSTAFPLEAESGNPANLDMEFEALLSGRAEIVPVRATASMVRDREGDLVGTLVVLRDITQLQRLEREISDRKRIERELLVAKDRANAAREAKSDFLAKISHEMRTPLNSILGMLELLSEHSLNLEARAYLRIAERSSRSLLELINDLLDVSGIEAGKLTIHERPFHFKTLVDEAIGIIGPRAHARGIAFDTVLSPGLPAHFIGDPVRIKQILLNLLGNAVKFTDQGSVRLEITVQDRDAHQQSLLLSIADTGIGIPADEQGKLFERFTQIDSGMRRRYGGSGLGLAITREIVRHMNGEIWFESDEGVGSRFFVRLPVRTRDTMRMEGQAWQAEDPLDESPPSPDATAALQQLSSIHILLAEDNPDNVALFRAFTKDLPAKIDVAENGMAALELFDRNHYDLILMDMQMPVMDGYTAVGEIRRREQTAACPRTPVIAFTAHALPEEKDRGILAGCDEHLTKPLKKSVLIETILKYATEHMGLDGRDNPA